VVVLQRRNDTASEIHTRRCTRCNVIGHTDEDAVAGNEENEYRVKPGIQNSTVHQAAFGTDT
jgi:hypothetical protein